MLVLLMTSSRKGFDCLYNFETSFNWLMLVQGLISARLWRGNINQRMPDFASLYGIDDKKYTVSNRNQIKYFSFILDITFIIRYFTLILVFPISAPFVSIFFRVS